MARQSGVIKIRGAIDDLNFTKKEGVFRAGLKRGGIADFATNERYKRQRDNAAEFTRAAAAASVIRVGLRPMLKHVKDSRMNGRLQKHARIAINADLTSDRGFRNIVDGKPILLEGFEFNRHGSLSSSLPLNYVAEIDRNVGKFAVGLPAFIPNDIMAVPVGATHYKISAGTLVCDFEADKSFLDTEELPISPIDMVQVPATSLVCVFTPPTGIETIIGVLGLQFYQQVNGKYYPLSAQQSNPLTIMKVDA